MIEHIQGTGLSGITGKTDSHGKTGLFAALMSILEKHAQTAGKGLQADGLQQHGKLFGKVKAGRAGLFFATSEKGDPLTTKKHAQLMTLATTGKHKKERNSDSAVPLVAANVITTQTVQSKKSAKTDESAIDALSGPMNSKHQQAALNRQTAMNKEQPLRNQPLSASVKAGASALNTVNEQVGMEHQESDSALKQAGKAVIGAHKAAHSTPQPHTTESMNSAAAAQPMASAGNTLTNSTSRIMLNNKSQSHAARPTPGATSRGEQISAERLVQQSAQQSPQSAPDTLDTQTSASTGRPDAHQVQQGKQTQAQQNSMNISAVTTMAASTSDTSLTDSGSNASNQGNHQDGSHIQILASDSKSAATSAPAHTQFQHYMSDKTAPTMTLFDSMTHIAQAAKKGKSQLDIQLEPANLGKIQISLQSDAAKQLHVHMVVDQSATRQLIDQQLPVLKQALAQQGFDLSGFSMGSQNQHPSSGGDHAHTQKGHTMTAGPTGSAIESATTPVSADINRTASNAGLSIRI